MHKRKLYLIAITGLILLIFGVKGYAQMHFLSDTLTLEPFTIQKSREHNFNIGSRSIQADSLTMSLHSSDALSDILLNLQPLNLRSNGSSGSLSTLSMRGAGGSRTLVAWNGIPINSLTTGDVNLSLIGASAFNVVTINNSAPSTLYGGNTSGGVLELNNTPEFGKGSKIRLQQKLGSFNTLNTNFSFAISDRNLSTQTQMWSFASSNNFDYHDKYYDRQMERQHAEHSNWGLMHNTNYRIHRSTLVSAGLWYQKNNANLPAENGSHPKLILAQQYDRSLRTYIKANYEHNNFYLSAKAFYLNEKLRFTQKNKPSDTTYTIESDILPIKQGIDGNIRYRFSNILSADAGIAMNRNSVSGTKYSSIPTEHDVAIYTAAKLSLQKFSSALSVRKEYHTFYNPPLRWSLGSEWQPWGRIFTFRFNFNQKFRAPTFNDKYWPEMGRTDLKPEKGNSLEAGINLACSNEYLAFDVDITGYLNKMERMIIWNPDTITGSWRPANIDAVTAKGLETRTSLTYTFQNGLWLKEVVSFDLNSSKEDGSSEQLIYTPKYRANSRSVLGYKHFNISFLWFYLSRRKYDDSVYSLPEYYNSAIKTAYTIALKTANINFGLGINNTFNNSEPYRKDYPSPGINYNMSIAIDFIP